MKLVLISDTHGHKISLPEGDVLIHAGDLTMNGSLHELEKSADWLNTVVDDYKVVYVIAGNHDFCFEDLRNVEAQSLMNEAGVIYLQDGYDVFEGKIFYGSPWQPWFYDWAFNLKRGEEIKKKWDLIPEKVDVLITHGPPYGILDETDWKYGREHVGCEELGKKVFKVHPLVHVFGHIHGGYGVKSREGINFVNASTCNEAYKPVNEPIVLEI